MLTYNKYMNQPHRESNYFKKKIECIRKYRNQKLQETDYIMFSDVSVNEDKKNKMLTYRQELRDIVNKILDNEIDCDMWMDDEMFEEMYFPKLNV